MNNKTLFIKYCRSGELNKIKLMMRDNIIYKEVTEFKPVHPNRSHSYNTTELFKGVIECVTHRHFENGFYLMTHYNVDIKTKNNHLLFIWFDCCQVPKYINDVLDLYDKILSNDNIHIYNKLFATMCANHVYDNVKLLLNRYKIDIYTKNEICFKNACISNDIYIVKLLILTSKTRPYMKMFDIYYLDRNSNFETLPDWDELFIYMASCGTYKYYKKMDKLMI